MTAMAPTNALRIRNARRSRPDGTSSVIRFSREEVSGSSPSASENGLFDMLDTFLSTFAQTMVGDSLEQSASNYYGSSPVVLSGKWKEHGHENESRFA
jgi:hypothetical protein